VKEYIFKLPLKYLAKDFGSESIYLKNP